MGLNYQLISLITHNYPFLIILPFWSADTSSTSMSQKPCIVNLQWANTRLAFQMTVGQQSVIKSLTWLMCTARYDYTKIKLTDHTQLILMQHFYLSISIYRRLWVTIFIFLNAMEKVSKNIFTLRELFTA